MSLLTLLGIKSEDSMDAAAASFAKSSKPTKQVKPKFRSTVIPEMDKRENFFLRFIKKLRP